MALCNAFFKNNYAKILYGLVQICSPNRSKIRGDHWHCHREVTCKPTRAGCHSVSFPALDCISMEVIFRCCKLTLISKNWKPLYALEFQNFLRQVSVLLLRGSWTWGAAGWIDVVCLHHQSTYSAFGAMHARFKSHRHIWGGFNMNEFAPCLSVGWRVIWFSFPPVINVYFMARLWDPFKIGIFHHSLSWS